MKRVTTTPRTVQTVTTKILKPVRAAAAGRCTAADLIESLPGFLGSGGVCGVAVAVFDEPWTSAFFDDRTRFGVAGEGLRLSGPSPGSVAEFLALALTRAATSSAGAGRKAVPRRRRARGARARTGVLAARSDGRPAPAAARHRPVRHHPRRLATAVGDAGVRRRRPRRAPGGAGQTPGRSPPVLVAARKRGGARGARRRAGARPMPEPLGDRSPNDVTHSNICARNCRCQGVQSKGEHFSRRLRRHRRGHRPAVGRGAGAALGDGVLRPRVRDPAGAGGTPNRCRAVARRPCGASPTRWSSTPGSSPGCPRSASRPAARSRRKRSGCTGRCGAASSAAAWSPASSRRGRSRGRCGSSATRTTRRCCTSWATGRACGPAS